MKEKEKERSRINDSTNKTMKKEILLHKVPKFSSIKHFLSVPTLFGLHIFSTRNKYKTATRTEKKMEKEFEKKAAKQKKYLNKKIFFWSSKKREDENKSWFIGIAIGPWISFPLLLIPISNRDGSLCKKEENEARNLFYFAALSNDSFLRRENCSHCDE